MLLLLLLCAAFLVVLLFLLLLRLNPNNNFTIDETPLTSNNVKNNFLYPEVSILHPKKRLLYP